MCYWSSMIQSFFICYQFMLVPCWLLFPTWNSHPTFSKFPILKPVCSRWMVCSALDSGFLSCDVKLSHSQDCCCMPIGQYWEEKKKKNKTQTKTPSDLFLVLVYMKNWVVIIWQIVQVLYMTCPLFFHFFSVYWCKLCTSGNEFIVMHPVRNT